MELFVSSEYMDEIRRRRLEKKKKIVRTQYHQVARVTNKMLKMHKRVWAFGGNMPQLIMQDRAGQQFVYENPEPLYTFLNFLEAFEFEDSITTDKLLQNHSVGELQNSV